MGMSSLAFAIVLLCLGAAGGPFTAVSGARHVRSPSRGSGSSSFGGAVSELTTTATSIGRLAASSLPSAATRRQATTAAAPAGAVSLVQTAEKELPPGERLDVLGLGNNALEMPGSLQAAVINPFANAGETDTLNTPQQFARITTSRGYSDYQTSERGIHMVPEYFPAQTVGVLQVVAPERGSHKYRQAKPEVDHESYTSRYGINQNQLNVLRHNDLGYTFPGIDEPGYTSNYNNQGPKAVRPL